MSVNPVQCNKGECNSVAADTIGVSKTVSRILLPALLELRQLQREQTYVVGAMEVGDD
jgi:hypothetical protein